MLQTLAHHLASAAAMAAVLMLILFATFLAGISMAAQRYRGWLMQDWRAMQFRVKRARARRVMRRTGGH